MINLIPVLILSIFARSIQCIPKQSRGGYENSYERPFLHEHYVIGNSDSFTRLAGMILIFIHVLNIICFTIIEYYDYDVWTKYYVKDKSESASKEVQTMIQYEKSRKDALPEPLLIIPQKEMKKASVQFLKEVREIEQKLKKTFEEASEKKRKLQKRGSKKAKSATSTANETIKKTSPEKEKEKKKTKPNEVKKLKTSSEKKLKKTKSRKMKDREREKSRMEYVLNMMHEKESKMEKQSEEKTDRRQSLANSAPTKNSNKSGNQKVRGWKKKTNKKGNDTDDEPNPNAHLKMPPKNFHEMAIKALEDELNNSCDSEESGQADKRRKDATASVIKKL